MITFPPFPANPFLAFKPPNYEQEWIDMVRNVIFTSVILLLVVPAIIRKALVLEHRLKVKNETKQRSEQNNKSTDIHNTDGKKIRVPFNMKIRIYIFYVGLVFYFICTLPNNTKTARHVYIAPLLHESECKQIIDIAFTAAGRLADDAREKLATGKSEDGQNLHAEDVKSLEKLLDWPTGWRKDRKECMYMYLVLCSMFVGICNLACFLTQL